MPSRRTLLTTALGGFALSAVSAIDAAPAARHQRSQSRRRILVFDVNETLLDMKALDPLFERAFGRPDVRGQWFSTVLLYSNVVSLAGPYADFGAIGGAALDMVAGARGIMLAPQDRQRILGG